LLLCLFRFTFYPDDVRSLIEITTDVSRAARFIADGRIVGFPTGTSYGLAVDAGQGWALQRLRNLKGRPAAKTVTVFLVPRLVAKFFFLTSAEQRLLNAMRKQPLTLLLTPQAELAHLAQDGRVGLRIIDHPLMAELAAAAARPLTATSANRTGEPPARSPADIVHAFPTPLPDNRLGEVEPHGAAGTTYDLSLAAIIDGGMLPLRPASTIARLDGDRVVVVRPGALATPLLERAVA